MTEPDTSGGLTVRRMVMGARLRRLREAAGLSREQAGQVVRGSSVRVTRLELGRIGVKAREIADLLDRYGVPDGDERRSMMALAQPDGQPGWWHAGGEPAADLFEAYVGLEDAASTLRRFETQVVPSLLQTEEYAEELATVGASPTRVGEVDAALDLRLARKRRLTAGQPLVAWFVLDEPVLTRGAERPQVLARQIDHIISLSEIPTVIVQILPTRLGGRLTLGGSFSMLRFAEAEIPDVVYLEQLASSLYVDEPEQVWRYSVVMEVLSSRSLSREESQDRLLELRGAL